jgi:hypothetical protein
VPSDFSLFTGELYQKAQLSYSRALAIAGMSILFTIPVQQLLELVNQWILATVPGQSFQNVLL